MIHSIIVDSPAMISLTCKSGLQRIDGDLPDSLCYQERPMNQWLYSRLPLMLGEVANEVQNTSTHRHQAAPLPSAKTPSGLLSVLSQSKSTSTPSTRAMRHQKSSSITKNTLSPISLDTGEEFLATNQTHLK
eukprot:c26129_g1_i2 orf=42-437(-)